MLEQVENKILELKKIQAEEYYKRKDADLQAWGLTYKTDGNKVTPIIVTDDEYEALIKASNGVDRVGRNPFAKALNVLAYISAAAGAVSGAVVAALSDELAFVYFTLCLVAGLVVGVIFKGMSEILKLLQQIIDAKPNEKPEDIVLAAEQAKAQPKQKPQPQQPVQPQMQVQAQPVQPQQAVYQPVFTTYPGGPAVYTQQQPVYVYQQPVQPQAQPQQAPQTGFRYGEKK